MGPFLAIGSYGLVSRFGHKRYRKQRTLYALTSDHVILMVGRAVSVDRISQMQALIARSTDRRHIEVRFSAPGDPRGLWIGGWMPVMGSPQVGKLMGNMGIELRDRGKSPLAFYDVADADLSWATIWLCAGRRLSDVQFCGSAAQKLRTKASP